MSFFVKIFTFLFCSKRVLMHRKGHIYTKEPQITWNKRKKSTLKVFIFQKNWKNGGVLEIFFKYFSKFNIPVTWGVREASFGSFCSIFYPLSNGDLAKLIRVQIKKLQPFKNTKNDIFGKKCNFGKFLFCSIRVPMHSKGHIYTKEP